MNIISAGLHRSGSTWLFNVLRLIFISTKQEVYSCFTPFDKTKFKENNIVKIHKYSQLLVREFAPDFIFLTKRDVRDIAASAVRRKMLELDSVAIINYLTQVVNEEYLPWKKHSPIEIQYEKLAQNKTAYIRLISKILKQMLSKHLIYEINVEVDSIARDVKVFDPVTQLHPNHVTDGGIGTFSETLPLDIIKTIEREFTNYLSF